MNLCFTTIYVQDVEQTAQVLDKVLQSINVERISEWHNDYNGTPAGMWYMYGINGQFCFAIGNAPGFDTMDQSQPAAEIFFQVNSREEVDAFAKAAKEASMTAGDDSKPVDLYYLGGTTYSCAFKDPNNGYSIGVTYYVSRLHNRQINYGNNFIGKQIMTPKYSVVGPAENDQESTTK